MTIEKKETILKKFCEYLTPERKEKFQEVANFRTKYITVVLEDIYQPHNASAILRSCECLGIQDSYIIEQRNEFKLFEGVAKGSNQWLDIKRFNKKDANNAQICFEELKNKNYKIVSASPSKEDFDINSLPLDNKIAIVFGTEQEGLSEYARKNSDYFVKIPMYGFTESFNVSVSAGICLYDITQRLRKSNINWQLSKEENLDLQIEWLRRSTYYTKLIDEALRS